MNFPQIEVIRPNHVKVYTDRATVVYSYGTPMAFNVRGLGVWVVRHNDHGNTTARHLKELDGGGKAAKDRVTKIVFDAIWKDLHEGILSDMMYSDDAANFDVAMQRLLELKGAK